MAVASHQAPFVASFLKDLLLQLHTDQTEAEAEAQAKAKVDVDVEAEAEAESEAKAKETKMEMKQERNLCSFLTNYSLAVLAIDINFP